MTVFNQNTSNEHIANGATIIFAYSFLLLDAAHATVKVDGVVISGYLVNGVGDGDGGSITFDNAPALNANILISRNVPLTQEIDYPPFGRFPAESHEYALDKLVLALQDRFFDSISRSGQHDNTMMSILNMNGYQITGLPTPVSPDDVIRLRDISYTIDGNGAIVPVVTDNTTFASASVVSVQTFRFQGADNGFTAVGAVINLRTTTLGLNSTATDVSLVSPDALAIVGSNAYAVRVRIRCANADFNGNISLLYETSTEAYSDDRKRQINISFSEGKWVNVVFDMRELGIFQSWEDVNEWQGLNGPDSHWVANTIQRLKLDIAQSISGNFFEIDEVSIGYFGSA